MDALMESVQKGAANEDHSKGYALSEYYTPARATQLEVREYAIRHGALLREVLKTSSDDEQRIVAAHLLGYTQQSKSQITALVHASRDANSTVRNNATRALLVLVESNPKLAIDIPVGGFAELLLSGTWTDLNKASFLLSSLTRSRNAKMLGKLRDREVVERLMEMARWRTHGEPARTILGHIAGADEERLQQLVTTGNVEEIINRKQAK
jgi:HEAT repeat protein